MENIESRLRYSGETLHNSQAARFKQPTGSQARNGVFEDLGSGFRRADSKPLERGPSKMSKHKLASDSDMGSDDEMDCLSQQSQADEKVVVTDKKKTNVKRHSAYDPDTLAKKDEILKKIKFKKKSTIELESDEPQKASYKVPSSSKTKAKMPRYRSDRENEPDKYRRIRMDTVKTNASSPKLDNSQTPRPKPRPRPRPIRRPPSDAEEDISTSFDINLPKKLLARTPSEFPHISPLSKHTAGSTKRGLSSHFNSVSSSSTTSTSSSSSSSSSHPPPPSSSYSFILAPSKSTPQLQAFPQVSPLNSPDHKHSKFSGSESFPALAPLSKDRDVASFPALSSLSKDAPKTALKPKKKSKGKRKADALTPFPMTTQDFGQASLSSEDESGSDKHDARRRRIQMVDEASTMADDMDLYEEDDSLFMAPGVDPKTLCPYCDAPLPPFPTRFFQNLLRSTYPKSYPDPRSTNPLGRKAPLSTFVAVCQRHDFESEVLPEAEAKGWPKIIGWEELGDRVANMKQDLEDIIQDPGDANMNAVIENDESGEGPLMTSFASKGPRMQCVFWREAMKTMMRRGQRAMTDVRGQFLDFENSQPGYYGELGQIIIQQTLFNLFPLDTFDLKLIKPFTANDFIQRILIPEVALRLIMEDRGLRGLSGAEEALQVLRESTTYGVTMFPEDSGEGTSGCGGKKSGKGGLFGIGDRIVMERARKRRKEIDEGGEIEALFENGKGKGSGNEIGVGRVSDRKQGKRRGREDRDDETDTSDIPAREYNELKPPRKASRKEKKPVVHEDVDAISIDSRSDGNDSELSAQTDRSIPRSRPKRSRNVVNYNNDSSDEGEGLNVEKSKPRRAKRFPSTTRNKPPSQANRRHRSPSASEWRRARSPSVTRSTIPKAQTAASEVGDVGSKPLPREISDMELCSSDDNSGFKNISDSNPKFSATSGKKLERSSGKQRKYDSDRIVDLDPNTPIPKRHAVGEGRNVQDEPTPKPITRQPSATIPTFQSQKQTVLGRARARKPEGEGVEGNIQTSKSKKLKLNAPTAHQWHHNIRSFMPTVPDSDDDDSTVDVVSDCEGMKRSASNNRIDKDKGSFHWLLDDQSS